MIMKIINAILSIVILISSIGISFNIHDCNYCGRSYHIFSSESDDYCCEAHVREHHSHAAFKEEIAECCHDSNSFGIHDNFTKNDDCCNNEFKFLKYEPKYFGANDVRINILKEICLFNILFDNISIENNDLLCSYLKTNPPPILLTGRSFIIYAQELKIDFPIV